ncbi:uncharacterized protein LOC110442360 [Mizuhopecten yessoensis]|uniref:uncharacterized protein LOC110442360 n=1 Tax=Mizuhopecten yessoensis TaxID=6573 RepID=UPI000B45E4B5|nr:uncharacterized protein LOC110442360 [Mizuhopecten yessoensis]
MMTASRAHVILACLLVCLSVLQTAADSHGQHGFSTAMCIPVDSFFVSCACVSFKSSISEAYDVVTKINFTGLVSFTDIIAPIQMYEKNLTDIVSRGVCRNLTDFQTCLDEYMPTSNKVVDHIIKSIINTTSMAQVLRSTFCTITQDLKNEVPTCLNDMILGSVFCVGIHNISGAFAPIFFRPNLTTELVQTAVCPSLGLTANCIAIQTSGCGSNINGAVSSMTSGLMTSSCKERVGTGEPTNILQSSVMACAMPLISEIGMQLGGTGTTTTPQQQIVSLILSIVPEVCSRLSDMLYCAGRYMPLSGNLLDKFLHNIIDMENVKTNEQAFSDGFCSSNAAAGLHSVITCMMIPNNTAAVEMCMTPTLQAKFATFDNTTELLAMDGATMRASFCSPIKTFVGCILDVIENKCNDTNVQSMLGTSRDMLLATLRSDCGGIREDPPDVGDGATGLNVYACVYLLLGLTTVLLNY